MEEELELKLVKRFPTIFRDYKGSIYETCMGWGLTCNKGWFDLLWKACEEIEEALDGTGIILVADQVKEKFAGLRFYYHFENIPEQPPMMKWLSKRLDTVTSKMCWYGFAKQRWWLHRQRRRIFETKTEKARSAVSRAEMKSYETCEDCGRPGKRRGGFYVFTACDPCFLKDEIRRLKDELERIKK